MVSTNKRTFGSILSLAAERWSGKESEGLFFPFLGPSFNDEHVIDGSRRVSLLMKLECKIEFLIYQNSPNFKRLKNCGIFFFLDVPHRNY
jgi:hypothetical protein